MSNKPAHLFCALLAAAAAATATPALAGTDRKIVSATLCQPEHPSDRDNVRYMARGVQAVGKDVMITCPLLRDSTLSGIKSLTASFQRGTAAPVLGTPLPGGNRAFEGMLFSCSMLDFVTAQAGCDTAKGSSDAGQMPVHSLSINGSALAHGDKRYYAFKVKLFDGTVLKSLTYTEND